MPTLLIRQADYHSYLLRLWRDGTSTPYHASLHCTATEQLYHFATVEGLFAFLLTQLTPDGDDATSPGRD